ncbi:hypothetical protein CDAR_597011 [Caerostris darwini]|uniref:Uncharacterized protein n=1 Tax=Caerostris darwini TaxID=1538125 RepID=A0AAV4U294_9ARAC|nr:hypothetical protein CDAR_597011 [Caerostris darwini]
MEGIPAYNSRHSAQVRQWCSKWDTLILGDTQNDTWRRAAGCTTEGHFSALQEGGVVFQTFPSPSHRPQMFLTRARVGILRTHPHTERERESDNKPLTGFNFSPSGMSRCHGDQ